MLLLHKWTTNNHVFGNHDNNSDNGNNHDKTQQFWQWKWQLSQWQQQWCWHLDDNGTQCVTGCSEKRWLNEWFVFLTALKCHNQNCFIHAAVSQPQLWVIPLGKAFIQKNVDHPRKNLKHESDTVVTTRIFKLRSWFYSTEHSWCCCHWNIFGLWSPCESDHCLWPTLIPTLWWLNLKQRFWHWMQKIVVGWDDSAMQ